MTEDERRERAARAAQIVQVQLDSGKVLGYRWGLRTVDPCVGDRVAVPKPYWLSPGEQPGKIVALRPSPDYDGDYVTVCRRIPAS